MALITDAHRRQFHEEGYFVVENGLPPEALDILRSECGAAIAAKDAEMDRLGVDRLGISHRGKRYFVADSWKTRPRMNEVIFSDVMASICKATIGDTAFLFYEQFVVKAGDKKGLAFSWHQDSGYPFEKGADPMHRPYVTIWCPMDDVSEENGTVYLLPYSRVGVRTLVRHVLDEQSRDYVGYFGKDPGDPVLIPAGGVAVFSSLCFHRSGPNMTDRMRRAWIAQFSPEPLMMAEKDRTWGHAIPFLRDGEVVHGKVPPPYRSRMDEVAAKVA